MINKCIYIYAIYTLSNIYIYTHIYVPKKIRKVGVYRQRRDFQHPDMEIENCGSFLNTCQQNWDVNGGMMAYIGN